MATEQAHAKLLSEVLQHPPLKHAETDDRSAPAIEPGELASRAGGVQG